MQARRRSLTISTVLLWMLCLAFANTIQALTIEKPAQDSVKITFDRNEGSGAFDRILKEYGTRIKGLVQLQLAHPNSKLIVRSNADAVRYRLTHNEKNAVKSLERGETGNDALALFGADMTRVIFVPLTNESDTGMASRYVVITFVPEEPPSAPVPPPPIVQPLEPKVCEPPAPSAVTKSSLGLHLGVGYEWTAFGGAPTATGAISYNHWLYVEAYGARALFNGTWRKGDEKFDTHLRAAGARIIAYPHGTFPLGAVLGFEDAYRINDVSGEYVQRFLSPTLGVRGRLLLDKEGYWMIEVTAAAYPGRLTTTGNPSDVHVTYGRIACSVTYNFGGGK